VHILPPHLHPPQFYRLRRRLHHPRIYWLRWTPSLFNRPFVHAFCGCRPDSSSPSSRRGIPIVNDSIDMTRTRSDTEMLMGRVGGTGTTRDGETRHDGEGPGLVSNRASRFTWDLIMTCRRNAYRSDFTCSCPCEAPYQSLNRRLNGLLARLECGGLPTFDVVRKAHVGGIRIRAWIRHSGQVHTRVHVQSVQRAYMYHEGAPASLPSLSA
jgi:hypothetical protein